MINRKDVMYKLTKTYTTEHNDGMLLRVAGGWDSFSYV